MKGKLAKMLFDECHIMQAAGVVNIKSYEIAFQDIIEKLYPYNCWWKITECNIFMHLLQYKNPEKTVMEIIHKLK